MWACLITSRFVADSRAADLRLMDAAGHCAKGIREGLRAVLAGDVDADDGRCRRSAGGCPVSENGDR
ncbi:hypothetical protein B0675_18300 [Streptomyces sp. M41(2017)]|nr:hypothetical protein B0675_18300 [Streptomyces sp. M41(2017)]